MADYIIFGVIGFLLGGPIGCAIALLIIGVMKA